MPVDNSLYERNASTWWQEDSLLGILRISVNPARLAFLSETMEGLGVKRTGLLALDIGCGGGFLTESLSRQGFILSGLDPSEATIAAASRHATLEGLEIDYRVGYAESLPFDNHTFDVVACCDVLEHVDSLAESMAEVARVLKPGGIFLYDTINRTIMSKLGVIFVAQEFPVTRFFPKNTHDWNMFIRPQEMESLMERNGITPGRKQGLLPAVSPFRNMAYMVEMKLGRLSLHEYALKTRLQLSNDLSMNYIGFGRRK